MAFAPPLSKGGRLFGEGWPGNPLGKPPSASSHPIPSGALKPIPFEALIPPPEPPKTNEWATNLLGVPADEKFSKTTSLLNRTNIPFSGKT